MLVASRPGDDFFLEKGSWRGPDPPVGGPGCQRPSRDGDVGIQIHVLNGVEDIYAFSDRPLEGLSTENQSHTARTLIDDRGLYGVSQVIIT